MTASGLVVAEAEAGTAALDNYKCYRIREGAFFNANVDLFALHPDFDVDASCKVKGRGRLYCVPASAQVSDLDYRDESLSPLLREGQDLIDARICYKVLCRASADIPSRLVEDQFGRRLLRPGRAQLLCTSASEVLGASTTTTTLAPVTTTTLPPPVDPELWTLGELQYRGAFRLSSSTFGDSSLNFSQGPLEYNAENHSIFIVGHSQVQAIAEFAVPELSSSATLSDLAISGPPLQNFSTVLERAPVTAEGNLINRIGGLELVGDALLINAYEYYDAPADNHLASMGLADASDLASSAATGFNAYEGGAGHTSGWISPIPPEWQGSLGGTHITGQSSGIPIIGRTSVGPSAFAFDPREAATTSVEGAVPTVKLLDYSLAQPLHADLSNSSGTNAVWTHLSRANYAMVVPGKRTYLAIGWSGGHASGVGYKITQDTGNLCGGYCSYEAADNYAYYWAFDLDDLMAVKAGDMAAHDVRPYAFGEFPVPFETTSIGGGTYDPASELLYLTLQRADREQGTYANPPVVAAFELH